MNQQIYFGAKQSPKNIFFALLLVMPVDTLYILFLIWILKTGQFALWHIFPLAVISAILIIFVFLSRVGTVSFGAGKIVIVSKLFGRKVFEAQMGEVKTVEMQSQVNPRTRQETQVIVVTLQNGKAADFFLKSDEETKVFLTQVKQAVGV